MYGYLALSLFLCLLASKVVKLLRLPNVTGYLIMGLLAGPYCLGLIPENMVESLSVIPEVALGFIAFSIGAEFKLSYLKKIGKAPVVIACFESVCAMLVVDTVMILTGQDLPFALALGAIAAATAPAATLMVVRQYKAKGPVSETLLPVVAIDDATALMCFGLSIAVAKAIQPQGDASLFMTILNPLIEIFGALALGAALGFAFHWLIKWFTGRGNRLAITWAMILLIIGICDYLGWSSLLCIMCMSAVLANVSTVSDVVFEQSDRITPPIFMLFFFLSGADLDISLLPTIGFVGVLYVVARVVGKWVGALTGATICHSPPTVRKYLGFALIPQAGVAIGLATVSMSVVPEHGAAIRTIILCGTVIYELVGPVVTKLALKKAGEIVSDKKPKNKQPAQA